jgi:sulfate adenylyltransferase
MIAPHGGTLIDRVVGSTRADRLRDTARDGPTISLDTNQYQDLINIVTGRFSPITGFLSQSDFLKVVNDMTLEDGTTWSLPVTLDVTDKMANQLRPSQTVGLETPDGTLVGAMNVEEVFKYNKTEVTRKLFGTDERDHPGVARYFDRGDFLVGGPVYTFETPRYNDYDLLPRESRVLINHKGWDSVVGFQTRNAPHRAHEYIQKAALEHVDGLLVQPKLGEKKAGDYRDETIMGAYQTLLEQYYPESHVALSVFPSKMRYGGPREAIFDALIRKNQGCTHFVVGRDHAGVADYYDGFDAHDIFDQVGDIGIEPVFFSYAFYCEVCDGMTSEKVCPHGDKDRVYPSGSRIRDLIQGGDRPSTELMRPEVAEFILDADEGFVTEAIQEGA